jgi:hypothetical protein
MRRVEGRRRCVKKKERKTTRVEGINPKEILMTNPYDSNQRILRNKTETQSEIQHFFTYNNIKPA